MRLRLPLPCALALLLTLAWVTAAASQRHMAVNPASRYATMQALIEHGTFAIDDTSLVSMTVDKVQWDGHFYSSKPPLLPALCAPYYALVRSVTGGFAEALYPTTVLMRYGVAVAPWLGSMLLWWALLMRVTDDARARAWGFVAMVLGGLPTAYASHLDNHSFAVFGLLAAAVAGATIVDDAPSAPPLRWWLAGLAAGGAIIADLGAAPIVGAVGAVALSRLWGVSPRRAFAPALAGLLVLPLAQAALQLAMSGSILPFYLRGDAYDYEGSYWRHPIEFDALSESPLVYAFHALLGHHGVFSVSPWLLPSLAAVAAARGTVERARFERLQASPAAWRARLAGAAAVGAVFVVVYYVAKTHNYGGRCVGMRWWMVLHPLLGVAATRAVAARGWASRRPRLLGLLIGLSAASALSGAVNPWEEGLVFAVWRAIGAGSVAG